MLPVILLFGSGLMGALRGAHLGGDVNWAPDYAAALQQARQAHRPLLFSFHSPDCGWCAKMDAETFTDPQVVKLSHDFICVRLDSEIDGVRAAHYQVIAYPTTLLTDEQGRVLVRLTGYTPPDRLAYLLRTALQTSRR